MIYNVYISVCRPVSIMKFVGIDVLMAACMNNLSSDCKAL